MKTFKYPQLWLFCLIWLLPTFSFAQNIALEVETLLAKHNKDYQFEGAVLVAKNGNILYRGSVGESNRKTKIPLNIYSKFRVASITKAFTAVLVMQLYEEGKLKLDQTLGELLPDFTNRKAKKITIHQLLMHTSGLPNEPDEAYATVMKPLDFLNKYGRGKLKFKPGQKFNYNNLDYVALGLIIEKITGKSWEEVLKEKIIKPARLRGTGVVKQGQKLSFMATAYSTKDPKNTNPKADDWVEDPSYAIDNYYAAAGMYSTTRDLFNFSQALYHNKLLKKETKALMYKANPKLGYVAYGHWVFKSPFIKGNPTIIERRGSIKGFNAVFVRCPEQNHTLVILSNNNHFNPDSFGDKKSLKEQLLQLIYKGK
ncbi:hypothetical protein BKI52_06935 [marine bacterium AO1-C]|nr:hypothetical protein BKI52_06935 [marine bacterium AO1-C]